MPRIRNDDGLPWPQLMDIAFNVLGVTPHIFWGMTPPEWMALLEARQGTIPAMHRGELEDLAQRFPDAVNREENARRAF